MVFPKGLCVNVSQPLVSEITEGLKDETCSLVAGRRRRDFYRPQISLSFLALGFYLQERAIC